MGDDGVSAKRFFMIGSDYVWPRTINKQLKGYWKSKGIPETSWKEEYVPFGFSNFQTLVNQVRAFADQPGGKPIVVLTVVGSSIPDFLREFANQGIKATDVPVLALDMVESDLEGLNTAPLVGHLNCWAYLQNVKGAKNAAFLKQWADYVKANNVPFKGDVAIDPMVSAYFKDAAQNLTMLQLINDRAKLQEQARTEMRVRFAVYNIDIQEVLIGTPRAPEGDKRIETLLDQIRGRQLAAEQQETYGRNERRRASSRS